MRRSLLIALCLLAALAGCGSSEDTAPVERVKASVAAAEAKDVDHMVSFLLPDERRDAAYQIRQGLAQVKTLTYQNPSYELQDNDGTLAHVRVTGTLRVELNSGQLLEQPIDQVLTLQKQDAEWYIKASEIQLPPR